jgi:hypothetical protein
LRFRILATNSVFSLPAPVLRVSNKYFPYSLISLATHGTNGREIERRFHRSVRNFQRVYVPLADKWQLFHNGLERPVEVAISENGETMILDDEYYQLFGELSKCV